MNVYTADSETDPFLKDRKPEPFAWDLFDGVRHQTRWGDDCTSAFIDDLYDREPGLVYIHNGGGFDVFYLYHYIDLTKDMLIIHGRITQCYIKCRKGFHRVRDSLKILPFSLETYQKTKIDYNKFERDVREQHKSEIVSYLCDDTAFLFELVMKYIAKFGPAITIGTTALKELQKFHNTGEWLTASEDAVFRRSFFYGGRVERYKKGVFAGDWKVFDVNSMYPYVMSNFYHPIDHPSQSTREITPETHFVRAKGFSRGAFPMRSKQRVLFPHAFGEYCVSIHEWNVAQELGLFDCTEILECQNFSYTRCFTDYIQHYYNLRKPWKSHLETCSECCPKLKQFCASGNAMRMDDIFYKYLLNNSYGKFAINPENFKEYRLTPDHYKMQFYGYEPEELIPEFNLILWARPTEEAKFNNIATAASITGAARSVLLRGLHSAVSPMYCDTDCIICEDLPDVEIDDARLGAWACEKRGNSLAIAGRKMYALFQDAACVKYACKGVKIAPEQIIEAALGKTVTYERDAPTFKLSGSVEWLTRKVRAV